MGRIIGPGLRTDQIRRAALFSPDVIEAYADIKTGRRELIVGVPVSDFSELVEIASSRYYGGLEKAMASDAEERFRAYAYPDCDELVRYDKGKNKGKAKIVGGKVVWKNKPIVPVSQAMRTRDHLRERFPRYDADPSPTTVSSYESLLATAATNLSWIYQVGFTQMHSRDQPTATITLAVPDFVSRHLVRFKDIFYIDTEDRELAAEIRQNGGAEKYFLSVVVSNLKSITRNT